MKTIMIDAVEVMQHSDPLQALAQSFGVDGRDKDLIKSSLISLKDPVIVEVVNWQGLDGNWEVLADLLEGVQQHSNTFYLIWGTKDGYVNTSAKDPKDMLINPPLN